MAARGTAACCFLLVAATAGQSSPALPDVASTVRIHLTFARQAACDPADHIALFAKTGATAGEGFVDQQCTVALSNVPPGAYRVLAVGQDIAATETANFTVTADAADVSVRVRRVGDPENRFSLALTSVSDLRVCPKLAKEINEARRLMGKQDWTNALDRLLKVVATDPNIPVAYNDLGVVYTHLASPVDAAGALRRAIQLDDHFALAYRNLGRLSLAANDFASAEVSLSKAAILTPRDIGTLALLAYAQYMTQHFDQALETCRQGHENLQVAHGILHLIAARAYGQADRIPEALTELRMYLSEEPNGKDAEQTRLSIAQLRSLP